MLYIRGAMPRQSDSPQDTIEYAFIVENECVGFRLDHFLMKKIPRLSRNRLQRVIRGECWVDGRVAKPATIVVPGQKVTFRRPAPPEPDAPRTLPVLVTDEHYYGLDKPPGIAMHPTAKYHHSTITSVMRELFVGEELQITHRLDLETSGALLIGRNREAAIKLKGAFAKRRVRKRYLAVVHGALVGDGVVDAPLGLLGGLVRIRMGVRSIAEGGQPARTRWRALQTFASHALVECWPETGRQHQIRCHLNHLGFPIVGDKLYPNEQIFADYQDHGWDAVKDRLPHPRQALHAAGLWFPHPTTGIEVGVESPLAPDLVALLSSLTLPV